MEAELDDFTNKAMCDGKYNFKDNTFMELSKDTWPAYVLAENEESVQPLLEKYPDATYLQGTIITEAHLKTITKQKEKFFYIVNGEQTFIDSFAFNTTPDKITEQYVGVYDNSFSIMQYNTDLVRKNISNYTTEAFENGKYALKFNPSVIKNAFETSAYMLGKSNIPGVTSLNTDEISLHSLNIIKRSCKTPYFYIIKETTKTSIDLSKPVKGYSNALTFWNDNDGIRLFKSDKVFSNIKGYTDKKWFAGEITDVANITDTDINVKSGHVSYADEGMDIVLLAQGWPEWCEKMADEYGEVTHIDSFSLGLREINEILEKCSAEYIYVVTNYVNSLGGFRFNYVPEKFDEKYIHVWNNNDSIRMFKRDMLITDASYCTDQALLNNIAEVKNVNDDGVSFAPLDIIFMSYEEPTADENYRTLKKRFPYAKRVDGVKGIFNAHKAASLVAGTHMFYVVDGDAVIDKDFDFSFAPTLYGQDCVYVWRSKNPCNGLEYGYGGVKLFPTNRIRNAESWRIDFTTSIARRFQVMPQISNITAYNTDMFSAWRSGYREGAKLSAAMIENTNSDDNNDRITAWTTVANEDVPFSEESMQGALAGFEYGQLNINVPNKLKLINDYKWLREEYDKTRVE